MKKVYCKRTYFENNAAFKHDDGLVRWAWGKIYECYEPSEIEKEGGIYMYIRCEYGDIWVSIKTKDFYRYFETLEDHRDMKINEVLK